MSCVGWLKMTDVSGSCPHSHTLEVIRFVGSFSPCVVNMPAPSGKQSCVTPKRRLCAVMSQKIELWQSCRRKETERARTLELYSLAADGAFVGLLV
jgi:hypothetical protein